MILTSVARLKYESVCTKVGAVLEIRTTLLQVMYMGHTKASFSLPDVYLKAFGFTNGSFTEPYSWHGPFGLVQHPFLIQIQMYLLARFKFYALLNLQRSLLFLFIYPIAHLFFSVV